MPSGSAPPARWTMLRLTLLALALALVAAPLATAQAPPAQTVVYELVMTCPGGETRSCPVTAIDPDDAMGDPALAVDPENPQDIILASLHGLGDEGGPSNKSRAPPPPQQPFTTFTSSNGGASWIDRPYTPPSQVGVTSFGQHPAITIDPYSHVFIGSLYAVPVGSSTGPDAPYDYVVATQKFRDIRDIVQNQRGQGDYHAEYLPSVYPGNAIQQMWFVFNRVTDNMTMVWTETVTPHSTVPGGAPQASHRLADVLHLANARQDGPAMPAAGALAGLAPRQAQQQEQPRSVIGVAWTGASLTNEYGVQARSQAIGPCSTSTNPVIKENWLYVGCQVAGREGEFPWDPEAEPGSIQMFRMHPDGGAPQHVGEVPIEGSRPKLGVRSDGRIAVMAVDVENGKVRLEGAFGQYSEAQERIVWGRSHLYGDKIQPLPANLKLTGANIQDLIYREYSGVLHIILKQEVEPREQIRDRLLAVSTPSIRKSIVAIDEKYSVLAELPLDIGNIFNRIQDPALMMMSDEVFNDISDDFLELPPAPYVHNGRSLGNEYQREFFAVADYGVVLFAEILEITELRAPGPASPPPPPPPPIPAPAPSAVGAAATAGALSASAIISGTAATRKRKAVVRAGRKRT